VLCTASDFDVKNFTYKIPITDDDQKSDYNLQIKYPSVTSISANADGPRDAASCKIDHIALHAN